MSLIVSPSATVDWALTRERLCDKALEKCNRLGIGRTVNSDDRALCLEALEGLLKNLLWYGYAWPKTVSGFTALSCLANVQTKTLPQDYYGGAMLKYVDASGNEVPLPLKSAQEWESITLKSNTAAYPDRGYIDNFNVLWMYPIPNQAITVNLYHQKVILDTVANSNVDLDSPWMIGLPYGIAAEVGHEFGVDPQRIVLFENKWREQRAMGVMNESSPGPDRITVSD